MIQGTYDYKGKKKKKEDKKAKKKRALKLKRKHQKKIQKQCECNHIARNDGKVHFKKIYDENGIHKYNECKICGAKLIVDEDLLSPDAIDVAAMQLETVLGLLRNKMELGPNTNRRITDTISMTKQARKIVERLQEFERLKKEKKKKKKNNHKKNKKNKSRKYGRYYR